MTAPALLLLDERSLGLAPALVQALFATIRDINRAGTSFLLVDADRLLHGPHVRDAYLGSSSANKTG